MLGVTFIIAICIGLLLGAAPMVIAIVFLVRAIAKIKKPVMILLYFIMVIFSNILLNTLAGEIIGCGNSGPMTGPEDLGNCFYFYIFFGASFGLSLLLGLIVFIFGGKK